jgi:drug/metabolite transporter (DMT)-like permease
MMRYLRWLSIAMTVAGVALAVFALSLDLDPVYALSGIMLAWAGVVKVVVVYLWTHVAGLGTDRHDPIPPL